ncbi:MAG: hypothetical protein DRH12_14720 [Deltaproteobacteria bacterium]|nr:MAG: hypothetical protein DRH12_14720 [Deltaproteobacteria bacterium]
MSAQEIKDYIIKRIKEMKKRGEKIKLYSSKGLKGEISRKFRIKESTAGYHIWKTLRNFSSEVDAEVYNEEIEDAENELISGMFTLEEELERQLVNNIEIIEPGLILKGRQKKLDGGIVDILAEDSKSNIVVIELKAGNADTKAVAQVLNYMGILLKKYPRDKLRAIIVAHDFDETVINISKAMPMITLKKYDIKIEIKDVTP